MKPIKVVLFFLVVILNFNSCETTKMRYMHNKLLRTELGKYSDVLDLARTEIYFEGGMHYFFNSSEPGIYLSLYVKPDHNNREILLAIRDKLIDFFNANWETREVNRVFPYSVTVNFTLGETKTFYIMYHSSNLDFGWLERWYSETFLKPLVENSIANEHDLIWSFGKPVAGKTIQELDALLSKYVNNMDIEQFDGYHSGKHSNTDFIKIWLFISDNYKRETVYAIRDDFVDFFENDQQELIEEYGQFNTIRITFYILEDIFFNGEKNEVKYPRKVYYLNYENNEWVERWY